MMHSPQNRQKKTKSKHACSSNVVVNRLSDLPDQILCKILSILPTKYAFATSALSKRWNNLFPFWTPPITLDFNDSVFLYPRKSSYYDMFVDFVDKTLFNVPCGVNVNAMMLTCCDAYHYGYTRIMSWVNAALELNVGELLLDVDIDDRAELLFCCLNGCTTLTRLELKLGDGFCLEIPPKCDFRLPNLKELVLFNLEVAHVGVMIDGCPLLEELCFDNCDMKDCVVIRIRAHLLKKLKIEESWKESECDLIIEAPNLETLIYDDTAPGSLSVSNLRSLRMAHINLCQLVRTGEDLVAYDEFDEDTDIYLDEFDEELRLSWIDCVAKLVKACSRTSQLYLGCSTIDALQKSSEELPEFQEMFSLTIDRAWGPKGWALLARLLDKSQNLEKLIVKEGLSSHGYSSFESLLVSPPVCLELHLKEIEFWLSEDEEDNLKFVAYLLKHGNVVQKLTLKCLPFKKACSYSRLSMLPGHSKIAFQPRYNRN